MAKGKAKKNVGVSTILGIALVVLAGIMAWVILQLQTINFS
jgi:hypothetical protein